MTHKTASLNHVVTSKCNLYVQIVAGGLFIIPIHHHRVNRNVSSSFAQRPIRMFSHHSSKRISTETRHYFGSTAWQSTIRVSTHLFHRQHRCNWVATQKLICWFYAISQNYVTLSRRCMGATSLNLALILSKHATKQSARRPQMLKESPTLGPYEHFRTSFPVTDVERTSHNVMSELDVRITFSRREVKRCPENFHMGKSRSSSRRHVSDWRMMGDPCRFGTLFPIIAATQRCCNLAF